MDEKEKNGRIALKQLAAKSGVTLLVSGGGIILWLVEFFGCILILRDAMRKQLDRFPDTTNQDSLLLGRRMCLFSSFILATAVVGLVLYVPDNLFTASFAQASEVYSSALGAEARAALSDMDISDRPGLLFFSQFLYAWLYGCIVSSILARNIPQDPRVREMMEELDRRMGKNNPDDQ